MIWAGSWRLRAAVFLVSAVMIGAEIILMRELALRFWEHLAWLVISVALLGFGASGTMLVAVHRFFNADKQSLQYCSLLAMALSLPLCLQLGDSIDLNLIQMAWQQSQFVKLGALEAALTVPFILGGTFIALTLQDKPELVPGHYSASFIGSAAGGILILPALFLLPPRALMLACSLIIMAASLIYLRGKLQSAGWAFTASLLAFVAWQFPLESKISEDKDVPQILAMPGSEVIARRYGPQGLVQILTAPAVHAAPGLSLMNAQPVPSQLLVAIDGQISGSLYQNSSVGDFAFLDNTTQALPYQLGIFPDVLIADAAGNEPAGLALYHGALAVTELTPYRSLKQLKTSELASRINHLYRRPEISLQTDTLRGYVYRPGRSHSLIVLPLTGMDFGGLRAAAADSLLTLETLKQCFARLNDAGVLAITTYAHAPPRESLRLLSMFIDVLHESGREPCDHIVVIRNWATVTLAAANSRISAEHSETVRAFAEQKGFDLVWLPDLKPSEVNRFHILAEPQYYLAAEKLLGPQKKHVTSAYISDLASPDDNKPFFHHFGRLTMSTDLSAQLGKRSRAYSELGVMLLIGALAQAFILALVLIVLPLIPVVGLPGSKSDHLFVIGFFAAIGLGFMLLEMGLLQRLTVYLSHPVYAASAVLSGFLLFGGMGSAVSSRIKEPLTRFHCGLGAAIAAIGFITLLATDAVLAATQGLNVVAKMAIVILLIGPAATIMGMMFPLGIKRVGRGLPGLVPWAWSVNGFSSVLATLCAPLMAMQWGFDSVALAALGCYVLAALLSLRLPW